jgi:hypothetical protein
MKWVDSVTIVVREELEPVSIGEVFATKAGEGD